MCQHQPPCPKPTAKDRQAARVIASHPEQGWSLLCNGLVLFADTGDMLPGGAAHEPSRPQGTEQERLAVGDPARLTPAAAVSGCR